MGEDMRTMMCADGLTVARSTLVDLVGFHSNALWLFAPSSCRNRLNKMANSRQNTVVGQSLPVGEREGVSVEYDLH